MLARTLVKALSHFGLRVRVTKKKVVLAVIAVWLLLQIVEFRKSPASEHTGPRQQLPKPAHRQWWADDTYSGDDLVTDQNSIGNFEWLATQNERRQQITDTCAHQTFQSSRSPREENQLFKQMLVDDVHNVLYCVIPKAACTSWKEALVFLTGNLNHTDAFKIRHAVHDEQFMASMGLRYLDNYDPWEIKRRLKYYTTIMTVRHPFERLLSAYRDKFAQKNGWTRYFHHKFGTRIIQKYRDNPSRETLLAGSDVTFEEFLRFIGDETIVNFFKMNEHWMQYQDLCQPCTVDYNFIMKLETLNEDSHEIIQRVFHSTLKLFPKVNSKDVGSSNLTRSQFSAIAPGVVERLFKVYEMDFKMFGYDRF